MPTKGNLHCIVRIDVEKPKTQHCWEVKIIRPRNSFHRSFSDTKYGGKDGALKAALKCRDTELKKRPAMNSYEQAMRPKITNQSGIVGVREGDRIVRRGSKEWRYPAWIATGTPISGGKTTTRYFVKAHFRSDKATKTAAIEQRQVWEKSLKESVEERLKNHSD